MNRLCFFLVLLLFSHALWAQQEIADTVKNITKPPVVKPPISLQQQDDYYKSSTGLPDILELPEEDNEKKRQYYTPRSYMQQYAAEYAAWQRETYGPFGNPVTIHFGQSMQLSAFEKFIVKLENLGVSFSAPVSVKDDNLQRSTNFRIPQTGMKPVPVQSNGNWYQEIEKKKQSPYLIEDVEDKDAFEEENPFKYMELIAQYVAN